VKTFWIRRISVLSMLLQFLCPAIASEVGEWQLHTKGLGRITIGMTVEEAGKVSNVKFEQFGLPTVAATFCTYYRGKLATGEIQMRVIKDRIDRIEVSSPGFSTLSGIRVGDPIERVKQIYGKSLSVEPHHYLADQGVLLMVLGPYGNKQTRYGVSFTASPEKGVMEIWVGWYEGIRESEGCS
jgi:hypothetical protein